MLEMLLIGGITGICAAIIVSLLFMLLQRRTIASAQSVQQAWERAQETRRQQWQTRQEERFFAFESMLSAQIQQLRDEWQEWEAKDAERAEILRHQYGLATTQAHIEYELARLPRVEDTPLTLEHQHNIPLRLGAPSQTRYHPILIPIRSASPAFPHRHYTSHYLDTHSPPSLHL